MHQRLLAGRLLVLLILGPALLGSDALFNAAGYRSAKYRAPLPQQVAGGESIGIAELQALLRVEEPVLIDVFAALRRPASDSLDSVWLVPRPRLSLPGAAWLPNVGYGDIDPTLDAYFRDQLQRLTGGDQARPIVIFCVTDCWMSWNAVKRAGNYGYRRLYWFREGVDAWQAQGLPLEPATAVPMTSKDYE